MKKFFLLIFIFCFGCHIPSKVAMEGSGGRTAYNMEMQKTNAEEMLLNLVRLRYSDSPVFLEVSSVTSTFTFKNSIAANVNIPGFNQTNPMQLGGETLWQTQPTIQYIPLEGQEFNNKLMEPLSVHIIQKLIYSGWDIDRIFLLTLHSFNEFQNFPAREICNEKKRMSNFENFFYLSNLMRKLQKDGQLQIGIREIKENDCYKKILQFAFPTNHELAKEIAAILNCKEPVNGKYVINIDEGFDEKGNVGILPRSLLSCMYYLSNNVLVPEDDVRQKTVKDCRTDKSEKTKKRYKELLIIKNCNTLPKNYYIAVKYRNSWFYISDNDINSKKTFMLLLELFNIQSGKRENTGPILTLPIGVG
ncbi:MAG: hypothetical protein WCT85_06200 [Parachlamydiales bacterium]